jgi:hypothetical protein
MSKSTVGRTGFALLLVIFAPLFSILASGWFGIPNLTAEYIIGLYGLLPLIVGVIGVLLLPLRGTKRVFSLLLYVLMAGYLLFALTPVFFIIACMLGDCV